MAGAKLVFRAHIEQNHRAFSGTFNHPGLVLKGNYGFVFGEVFFVEGVDLGKLSFRLATKEMQKSQYGIVVQAIEDVFSLFARSNEAGQFEFLKLGTGVFASQLGVGGEGFNRFFP